MSSFPCAAFWLNANGEIQWAHNGHEDWVIENLPYPPAEAYHETAGYQGYFRCFFFGHGHLYIDGSIKHQTWADVPRAAKEVLEDLAFKYNRKVDFTPYDGLKAVRVIEKPTAENEDGNSL